MHSISRQKHSLVQGELIPHALANLIRCPPVAVLVCQLVRRNAALCRLQNQFRRNLRPVCAPTVANGYLPQLDIQSHQLLLTGDDHDTAVLGGVDGAPHADIREVRDGDDVQYTPDVICRVARERVAELLSCPRVRAVTAYHEPGSDGFGPVGASIELGSFQQVGRVVCRQVAAEQAVLDLGCARLLGGSFFFAQSAEGDCDGVIVEIVGLCLVKGKRRRQNTSLDVKAAVVLPDGVQEKAFNAALVQNNLLEPTDADDCIGNTIGATDPTGLVGIPETDFDHVVGLAPGSVANVEGVQDFEGSALQAVGLAVEDLCSSLVDDTDLEVEPAQPVRQHEAGGAGAHDENIDTAFFGRNGHDGKGNWCGM